MTSFSIDAIWEDMIAFLRRESGLVLPLALATFGVAMILLGFTAPPIDAVSGGPAKPGLQSLMFLPAMLFTVVGNMAISLLVLRSGATVGDSLRTAIRRLPVAIAISLLVGVAACLLFFVALVIVTLAPVDVTMRGNLTVFLITVPVAWVAVRLFLMWPLVADSTKGPIDSVRQSFALTKGHALRSLVVIVIFGALYISLISITQLALLPVIRLLGMATGQVELLKLIGDLITAFIGSVLMMGWTVYLAFAYRRLTS